MYGGIHKNIPRIEGNDLHHRLDRHRLVLITHRLLLDDPLTHCVLLEFQWIETCYFISY